MRNVFLMALVVSVSGFVFGCSSEAAPDPVVVDSPAELGAELGKATQACTDADPECMDLCDNEVVVYCKKVCDWECDVQVIGYSESGCELITVDGETVYEACGEEAHEAVRKVCSEFCVETCWGHTEGRTVEHSKRVY